MAYIWLLVYVCHANYLALDVLVQLPIVLDVLVDIIKSIIMESVEPVLGIVLLAADLKIVLAAFKDYILLEPHVEIAHFLIAKHVQI